MSRPILACLLVLVLAVATARAENLAPLLLSDSLWSGDQEAFITTARPIGFGWTGPDKSNARQSGPGNSFGSLPIIESSVWFAGAKPNKAAVLFFSRGDSGDLDRAKFENLVTSTRESLTAQFGNAPAPVEGGAGPLSSLEAVAWDLASGRAVLEWSYTREVKTRNIPFRAEFLRLVLFPPGEKKSLVAESLDRRNASLASTIVEKQAAREPNGDVVLRDVPMVDQGEKGYCVVASAERVLSFYGRNVDQHELAQIANASAETGTSPDAMVAALKALTTAAKIRVRTHYAFEVKTFIEMVRDYNRFAKRNKQPEVDPGQIINVSDVYQVMNPDSLKQARLAARGDHTRFLNDVHRDIDAGVPLLWSVMIGVVREPMVLPQAFGGHMRLIIGYNDKTGEILYSDSWGKGHELKRMPADDAWTITTGLYAIESR